MHELSQAKFKEKTIVVTGAGGYIGSALVDALVSHSCRVIRVSRNRMLPLAGTESIEADIRDIAVWEEIIKRAQVIYHLAGNTSVYEAAKNPAESLHSTLLPLNHLINAAQIQQRKPRVVFTSTATVYGLTTKFPVAESVQPEPITVYDMHKLFAEQQLALATHQGSVEGISLRLANVYGVSKGVNSAEDRGILNKILTMALHGSDLNIYGDGKYLRDYVYITDVIDALLLAGVKENLGGQSYNIASGIGKTIKQVFEFAASEAEKFIDKRINVNFVPWPESSALIELRQFVADIEKFKKSTGWNPRVNIEQGVLLMLNQLSKRENKYDY